jgi:hypothetical protein
MTEAYVAVISSGRARNVPTMQALAGDVPLHWYVGDGEAGSYRYVGAEHVTEAGTLCVARNRALNDAAGQVCVQVSDDLRKLGWAVDKTTVEKIGLGEAVGHLRRALDETGAHLAGAAPTANPFFSAPRIHSTAFIVGDLIAVVAGCDLRFDEQLRLKEDYDYTAQHLRAHGQVARVDQLMATFQHRTNRGGAVDYRTGQLEDEAIQILQRKWPGCIRENPRRPHEVLFRWKP